jgi:hypothetical protein
MSSSLTVNGFNIGTNITVTISDQFGDVFNAGDLGHLQEIGANFDMEMLKISPITRGGKPMYLAIPSGLSGTMRFTRFNGALTSMFTQLYQLYYNNGILPKFTITVSVINPDSTTDQYIFTGVVFSRPGFGDFQNIREVDQGFSWNAENCVSTSNLSSIVPALAALAVGV